MISRKNPFIEAEKYVVTAKNMKGSQRISLGNHSNGHGVNIAFTPSSSPQLYLGFNCCYHVSRSSDDRIFHHFASRDPVYTDIAILTLVNIEMSKTLQDNKVIVDGEVVFEGFAPYFDTDELRGENYRETRLKLLRFLGRAGI